MSATHSQPVASTSSTFKKLCQWNSSPPISELRWLSEHGVYTDVLNIIIKQKHHLLQCLNKKWQQILHNIHVQQLTSPRFWATVLDRSAVGHAPAKGTDHFDGSNFNANPHELQVMWSSSSRTRVINHNWSATKQRLHPQSVGEISRHSVLSGDRIRQCETSSGSRHINTDQCL